MIFRFSSSLTVVPKKSTLLVLDTRDGIYLGSPHHTPNWHQPICVNFPLIGINGAHIPLYPNLYIWFQYRTLLRILRIKDHLNKLNLSESFTCGICSQQCESNIHLFARCQIVLNLLGNIKKD